MRNVRHASTLALVNLLHNGGLDYLEDRDSYVLPHFWQFGNLVPRSLTDGSSNTYDVVQGEEISHVDAARDYMRLFIQNNEAVRVYQRFDVDPTVNVLDFPQPLAAGSARSEMPEGFRSTFNRVLTRSRDYSFGVSFRVLRGRVNLRVQFYDSSDNLITDVLVAENVDSRFTNKAWRRLSGSVTPAKVPGWVSFTVERAGVAELCEVHMSLFQLSVGSYQDVPYTGDPSLGVIPKDTIVLAMGSSCPPGFVELGNDNLQPLNDWLDEDGEAEARVGQFPIGDDGSGELKGDFTHNRSSYDFSLETDETVPFESFDSRWGSATSGNNGVNYNPNVRTPADEPNDDGVADHQHSVDVGSSVPVNRSFLFCRRL